MLIELVRHCTQGVELRHLQDYQLQFCYIILMNPVLCGLTDKVLLATSRTTVAPNRVASCSDQVVQLRDFYNELIVVLMIERFGV